MSCAVSTEKVWKKSIINSKHTNLCYIKKKKLWRHISKHLQINNHNQVHNLTGFCFLWKWNNPKQTLKPPPRKHAKSRNLSVLQWKDPKGLRWVDVQYESHRESTMVASLKTFSMCLMRFGMCADTRLFWQVSFDENLFRIEKEHRVQCGDVHTCDWHAFLPFSPARFCSPPSLKAFCPRSH